MPRARTIRPNFPHLPAMTRVGRDARLLFILLWTAADDAGRLRLLPEQLCEQLLPHDPDAPAFLAGWLDQLEGAGAIERYSVDGCDVLRIVQWRQLQSIQHPKPSRLPAAPSEPLHHDDHDDHDESPESQPGRASKGKVCEIDFSAQEAALLSEEVEITPQTLNSYLSLALRKAIAQDGHTAAARHIELAGRTLGLWRAPGAPAGRKEPAAMSPGPHELLPPNDDGETHF